MISAKEAKLRAANVRGGSVSVMLTSIEQQIERASDGGYFAITLKGDQMPNVFRADCVERLRGLGYRVEHNTGDQREPEDYWTISWS